MLTLTVYEGQGAEFERHGEWIGRVTVHEGARLAIWVIAPIALELEVEQTREYRYKLRIGAPENVTIIRKTGE